MIRSVSEAELPAVGRLYQAAFREALTAVFGRSPLPVAAVDDVFHLIYEYEKEGLLVAVEGEQVLGFILAVSDRDQFQKHLLWGGGIRTILSGLLSGRYRGIGLRFIPRLLGAAWHYRESPMTKPLPAPVAQILSIVVDPMAQGQGVGKSLMQASLAYLRTTSAHSVRLEVDASKPGPHHLYREFGFEDIGSLPSPRGTALIMGVTLGA